MDKAYLTITKFWHSPIIQVLITNEGLGLRMDIEDFKKAVRAELSREANLEAAISRVIDGIKEESRKAV